MREWRRNLQRMDWGLYAAAATLALMGGIAMASAASTINPRLAVRHDAWIVLGMIVSFGASQSNYRRQTELAWLAYGLSLVALAMVSLAGVMRLGATRWLSIFGVSVQPSEVAKLTTIWLLARELAGRDTPLSGRTVWTSLLFVIPPALLVLVQPDLGSASVFIAIWVAMIWVAGASRRSLVALAALTIFCLPLGWQVLKDYQRDRLLVFLDPHADPLGAGFSIIQSTIAIGSGRFWGRGWFAGTQNQLSFLPERHSDFIFSVIGEEWGFCGSVAVVTACVWLLLRIARIASETRDPQGRFIACGILAWLAYQSLVNIGMVMGVLPVVGVPLPLVSYGGSSMLTLWVALGLLQSIRRGMEL